MEDRYSPLWAGLTVIAGFVVGICSFLAGLLAIFNEYNYIGAGLCFLASAIIFGLMSNSIFRK
ncbi:MAG: hypothetical protein ACK2UM_04405 [Anaerolineales bacterium]|jgi:hypothetical protein